MKQQRIGIMGGTFDPIHNGHLSTASNVKSYFKLDKIMFVPSGTPPHKRNRIITDAKHRVEMIKIALAGNEDFSLSTIEVDRKGYSYTYDTLLELQKSYCKETSFYFIIGADVVPELFTWHKYKELFAICEFIAVLRPGFEVKSFFEDIDKMEAEGARINPVRTPLVDASSSKVRECVREGKDCSMMLPDGVLDYIMKEGLYR